MLDGIVDQLYDTGSQASATSARSGDRKKKWKKFVESLDAICWQVLNFIKPGELKTVTETVKTLEEHFQSAQVLGAEVKLKAECTQTGMKDAYQMHFVNQLLNSYKGCRSLATKIAALNQAQSTMPEQTMSPV
uniref:Uncharacterized protein n=1 Tax=Moniliophthora roreri TaxID=221103 RepID=A0A0W0FLY7_MONRR